MKKNLLLKTVFIFILMTVFFARTKTWAQSFSLIKLGPAVPLGAFNEGNLDKTLEYDALNGASLGFGIGYYHRNQIVNSFGLFYSVDVFYNGLDSQFRDEWEDFLSSHYEQWDIRFFHYINIPVNLGGSYALELPNGSSFFLEAGLNLHFLKITGFHVEFADDGYSQDSDVKFGWSYNIGFVLSGAYQINDRLYVCMDYYPLGKTNVTEWFKIHAQDERNNREHRINGGQSYRQSVELFRIGLGIKL